GDLTHNESELVGWGVATGRVQSVAVAAPPSFNGKQGVRFNPADFSTLFQDAAGTIPVTAVGQPVALMRDTSGNNNHLTLSNAPLDLDADGYHIAFNGTSTFGVTPSTNFTDTDGVTIIASVHKSADANIAVIAGLSDRAILNTNTFSLLGPVSSALNNFGAYSRGSGARRVVAVVAPAPATAVVTVECDI